MSTLRNGKLVAAVAAKLATAEALDRRRPGRRALAQALGASEHEVRVALEALEAEWAQGGDAEVDALPPTDSPDSYPLVGPGGHETAVRTQRPVGELGDDTGRERATVGDDGRDRARPGDTRAGDGRDAGEERATGRVYRWPLLLLALPAFVAIWGGWVGLGRLVGFGRIELLPGIGDGLVIDSAITLPIGLETYAACAMHVWLSGVGGDARRFARISALASLGLGALGQIAYHLMAAAGMTVAPWWITAIVATVPVAVFGMGGALAYLIVHGRRVNDACDTGDQGSAAEAR